MFKIKKAQGMSMNVIIIAVLALLVLVIISVIFTSKMRSTRSEIDSCTNSGGRCIQSDLINDPDLGCKVNDYQVVKTNLECPTDQTCCISVK